MGFKALLHAGTVIRGEGLGKAAILWFDYGCARINAGARPKGQGRMPQPDSGRDGIRAGRDWNP